MRGPGSGRSRLSGGSCGRSAGERGGAVSGGGCSSSGHGAGSAARPELLGGCGTAPCSGLSPAGEPACDGAPERGSIRPVRLLARSSMPLGRAVPRRFIQSGSRGFFSCGVCFVRKKRSCASPFECGKIARKASFWPRTRLVKF